jgi:protein involved in polysaccharide export with SLBB domain
MIDLPRYFMNVRAHRDPTITLQRIATLIAMAVLCAPTLHATAAPAQEANDASIGPVRLGKQQSQTHAPQLLQEIRPNELTQEPKTPIYRPGEFEVYVQKLQELSKGQGPVKRLGADLVTSELGQASSATPETPRQIPLDYLIGIGEEIQVSLWGSVDADLRLTVDNSGRIIIPRVGPILVSGLRYAELNQAVEKRVGQVFRNFQVSTTLGKLRGIRVYVTGFVQRPGSYSVSSLSTLINALTMAGGPSAAGSFRVIELRRAGRVPIKFDLYDLLLKGDRSSDLTLQAEDVVHIHPVGPQIAVLGSINNPTVAEVKPGETVDDAIRMAGGFTPVADRTRLSMERISERNDRRVAELPLPTSGSQSVSNGDVIRVFSSVASALPQHKQYKRVQVEGEVLRPGEYILPPHSTLKEALKAAGGLTPSAYLFGTEFMRESVRMNQQDNYERALRDLETEFAKSIGTQRTTSSEDANIQQARTAGTSRLIERLRAVKPTGRVVLQLPADADSLPELSLEDGDRLLIPARPIEDTLRLAGGPTRGADPSSTFVLRANGSVISAQQTNGGWITIGSSLSNVAALPGDTIFVPEEMNKTTFAQSAKEWTQILYQFGLGAAALKTIKN